MRFAVKAKCGLVCAGGLYHFFSAGILESSQKISDKHSLLAGKLEF